MAYLKYDVRKTREFQFKRKHFEIYKKSHELQKELEKIKISWHNPLSDECQSDFGCCEEIGNFDLRIPSINSAQRDAVMAFASWIGVSESSAKAFISDFLIS